MVERLDGRVEAQPDLLARQSAEALDEARLVLRANRAHVEAAAARRNDCRLELGRVRLDGEATVRMPLGANDPQARIDRDDPGRVRQQRIDVDFGDLGKIDDELRHLEEGQRDGVEVGGFAVAVSPQPLEDARALDHGAGKAQIERGELERRVVDDLDADTALAEHQHGTEASVLLHPEDQLTRARPRNHLFDDEREVAGLGHGLADSGEHLFGRMAYGPRARQPQRHAADIGLVDDVGRLDLERDRRSDRVGDALGFVGGSCRRGSRGRDAIGRKHLLALDAVQPLPARAERALDDPPRLGRVACERRRDRRRRRRECILCASVADEMHERAHAALGRRVAWNAPVLERLAPGLDRTAAEPDRDERLAGWPRRRRNASSDFGARRDGRRTIEHQSGIDVRVGEHRLDGGRIPLRPGVADDVDGIAARPGLRHTRVERRQGRG